MLMKHLHVALEASIFSGLYNTMVYFQLCVDVIVVHVSITILNKMLWNSWNIGTLCFAADAYSVRKPTLVKHLHVFGFGGRNLWFQT